MKLISNKEFGGERPLFASHDLHLDNVTILAGESAIKECSNISLLACAWLYHPELLLCRRRAFRALVFRPSENDGYGN